MIPATCRFSSTSALLPDPFRQRNITQPAPSRGRSHHTCQRFRIPRQRRAHGHHNQRGGPVMAAPGKCLVCLGDPSRLPERLGRISASSDHPDLGGSIRATPLVSVFGRTHPRVSGPNPLKCRLSLGFSPTVCVRPHLHAETSRTARLALPLHGDDRPKTLAGASAAPNRREIASFACQGRPSVSPAHRLAVRFHSPPALGLRP